MWIANNDRQEKLKRMNLSDQFNHSVSQTIKQA